MHSYRREKKTHESVLSWLSWLAVLLVGATLDGATTTTESRNMVAILQLIITITISSNVIGA